MTHTHCERCPLKRHRRPCAAHWDGCGEACALIDGGDFRHELVRASKPDPSSAELEAFRGLLPSVYWEREKLIEETVTLFVPLSGRDGPWASHLRPFLDGQAWPRKQTRLVLADTSQRDDFGDKVQRWLSDADYPDSRYYTQVVGERELSNKPRPNDGGVEVNTAMRAIYRRMAEELTTRFVLVVEDDHRPPPNTVEKLLRGMDARTAAVSGLYRGREPAGHYVAWSPRQPEIHPALGPAIPIAGSGFGTLLLRRDPWLVAETFAHTGDPEPFPYDIGFAWRVARRGGIWKAARDVLSDHFGAPPIPAADVQMVARGTAAPFVQLPQSLPPSVAFLRDARRLNELVNQCPSRGCKTGCGNARCLAGKGDQAGGTIASITHCRSCIEHA